MLNYKGNKWYKCDFHLHTPASKCFTDKDITPKEYIKKVKDMNLDCIAITDHNTAGWIDKIKQAVEETQIDLTVFPGVELTAGDTKTHLLILFEVDNKQSDIEDFLVSLEIDRKEFGQPSLYVNKTIKEVLDKCAEKNLVVIPAHIDDYSGLCDLSDVSMKSNLQSKSILAVQMVKKELIEENYTKDELIEQYEITADQAKKYINCAKEVHKQKKAILTFSDNPDIANASKHGVEGIGKQFTYIKMNENPNLESLRQAFLFPEHRIKNYVQNQENPLVQPVNWTWVKKVTIENISTSTESIEVDFNPQLTTIIGGRGTGKSTIVKILSMIFRKQNTNDSEIEKELKDFYSNVLKEESKITIEFVKNTKEHKIVLGDFNRNYQEFGKIEYYKEGQMTSENISYDDLNLLANIDIYNQKQVYEISKEPDALVVKIDSLIPEIEILKQQSNEKRRKYKELYSQFMLNEQRMKEKSRIQLELDDVREKIQLYKDNGLDEILKQCEQFEKQEQYLNHIIQLLEKRASNLKVAIEENQKIDMDSSLFFDEELSVTLQIIYQKTNSEYVIIVKELEKLHNQLEDLISNHKKEIESSRWKRRYEIAMDQRAQQIRACSQSGVDISQIDNLITSEKQKQQQFDELERIEAQQQQKKADLAKIRQDIIDIMNRIHNERRNYLNEILDDTNIKIDVKKHRNKKDLEKNFREIIQKTTEFSVDVKAICDYCFDGDVLVKITEFIDEIENIRNNGKTMMQLSQRFKNVIINLNDEQMAEINLLIPTDELDVKYKSSGRKVYSSIKNASAGQKTSTILTFILSDGETPLVLDQPEDDLDNKLIYELIVEGIKKSKERRQIIIVTHNANIPVNGDAELIIAMDSQTSHIAVQEIGSIEADNMKQEICAVMEGGERAFKMRASRYNL